LIRHRTELPENLQARSPEAAQVDRAIRWDGEPAPGADGWRGVCTLPWVEYNKFLRFDQPVIESRCTGTQRMPRSLRIVLAITLVTSLFLVQPGSSRACPNCKEAISAQPEEVAGMAAGFNRSILLMLSVPMTLLATGIFVVRRAAKLGMLPEI